MGKCDFDQFDGLRKIWHCAHGYGECKWFQDAKAGTYPLCNKEVHEVHTVSLFDFTLAAYFMKRTFSLGM